MPRMARILFPGLPHGAIRFHNRCQDGLRPCKGIGPEKTDQETSTGRNAGRVHRCASFLRR